jgi:hypothetical protein
VLSTLGVTDEPGEVDGYGPVPASVARRLVSEGAGSVYRLLVDPRDGAPLEIGRRSYRLPEGLKKWLRVRDGKCTFPGCSNHTADNENDHLTAWEHGGATGVSNLGQVCPKHHRLKHQSRWTPTPATKDEPPGWTSPTGRHYPAEQPDRTPPIIPPELWPASSTGLQQSSSTAPSPDNSTGLPDNSTGLPLDSPTGLRPVGSTGPPLDSPTVLRPVGSTGLHPGSSTGRPLDSPTGLRPFEPTGLHPGNSTGDFPVRPAEPDGELSLLERIITNYLAA